LEILIKVGNEKPGACSVAWNGYLKRWLARNGSSNICCCLLQRTKRLLDGRQIDLLPKKINIFWEFYAGIYLWRLQHAFLKLHLSILKVEETSKV
jgi:hypothetical protein